jgi:hypothetical protein
VLHPAVAVGQTNLLRTWIVWNWRSITENIFLTLNFLVNVASHSNDLFQYFNHWLADKPSIPPVRIGFVHNGLPHFCNFPVPCVGNFPGAL